MGRGIACRTCTRILDRRGPGWSGAPHPCTHASLAGAQAYAHGHATLVSELILPAVNEGCCAHKPNVRGGEGRGRGPFFECSL